MYNMKTNKEAYAKLIEEDITFLEIYAKPSIERDHIKHVLLASIELLYPSKGIKTKPQ